MVLKEDEVALCDLLDYNFAYGHTGFFSLPPRVIDYNRLHEIVALNFGPSARLHVVLFLRFNNRSVVYLNNFNYYNLL